MKAVVCTRYGPPEVLHVAEVAKPILGSREVSIKIQATAVTVSDCIIRGFNVPPAMRLPMGLVIGFRKPRRPILGMVLSGEVESIGPEVQRFAPGDQVYACNITRFGAYAEYACLPEQCVIAPKPTSLTYEEAAAIPYGGMIASHFLRRGGLQSGMSVLIYGASGAVGISAVQLAKASGAQVTGVCSGRNLDLVRSLGADATIDYTAESPTLGGTRYDLIFDAAGKRKESALKQQFRTALTPRGTYLSVDTGSPKLRVEDLLTLTELVNAEKLKAVIDRSFPLEQIVEAHRYVEQGHKKGNVIITVGHA